MANDDTQVLNRVPADEAGGAGRLIELIYDDLHSLADRFLRGEYRGHAFSASDLVSEVFLKLVQQTRIDWQGKTHFFAVGAQAMRRILVDHARSRRRLKRGGGRRTIALRDDFVVTEEDPEGILAIDEAITRLAGLDPVHARIVDCRFFGGMTNAEIARLLGVTTRTVERHWAMIRAWLARELSGSPAGGS